MPISFIASEGGEQIQFFNALPKSNLGKALAIDRVSRQLVHNQASYLQISNNADVSLLIARQWSIWSV